MLKKTIADFIVCALWLGALSVHGQHRIALSTTPAGLVPALETIRGDEILRHIKALASDEFEGRAPGTQGEDLTVNYIARKFKDAGIRPGGPGGSFLQKVPLTGYRTTASIEVKTDRAIVPLKFYDDFVHDVPRLTPQVYASFSGVVFAGYGITAPQFGWDDYKNVDVRNKLVIVLGGEPSRTDKTDQKSSDTTFFKGKLRTYYSTRDFKFQLAQKRGAAGILVISNPKTSRTFSLFQTFARMEGMALKQKSAATSPAIAGLITQQAAERLFTAAGSSLSDATQSAEGKKFRAVTLKLSGRINVKSELRNVVSRNVVATIEGSDPVLKRESIVYSAHWDHLGRDPNLTGDQIYNGANDNAAGTAQLIEIAAAFAAMKIKPKRSITFVATTAEEKGFLGARYFAQNLSPAAKPVAAFNLDAGNLFGLTTDLASSGYGQSTLDEALEAAAKMQGRAFLRESLDGDGGYYFASDQIEFAKVGIPAVFPWNGDTYAGRPSGFGEKKWAEYGAERYHKVSDEVMADWDMAGAVEDARWMFLAGILVANNAERPRWYAGNEFQYIGSK